MCDAQSLTNAAQSLVWCLGEFPALVFAPVNYVPPVEALERMLKVFKAARMALPEPERARLSNASDYMQLRLLQISRAVVRCDFCCALCTMCLWSTVWVCCLCQRDSR